ncbi:6-phosphogluconate dehydrogenase family protein [Emericellopsis cladophorae]|uniref:6-phosphogluconate dehydrogenase family protein n=1 Tax=Emericellopsis cladophorae TaxID=2686198 RepID=A0A9Q0BBE0_9HYPO|nr:6-phosphogluconate dehydrogenase family protein [Emericellopsis cladophorae]KAI6778551.1 6-phosphogluconate dehydrogenase family protein [Emericellopsis cladophorae]
MMTAPKIGWIGLGSMGLPMAMNLQTHLRSTSGEPLSFTNRTLSRGDPLLQLGATSCSSVPDVVAQSHIIFMSLSDDAALEATISAILRAESSLDGKVVVDTSTVHPDSSARAELLFKKRGASFVASPVFGASPVAQKAQLLFMIAGPNADVASIMPYVTGVMGRGVIRLGEDVRQSSLLKTAGNFMTAGMMELIAETHVFAEKAALPSDAVATLLKQNFGPLAHTMSERLTLGAYCPPPGQRPWSDLNLAVKDVGHGVKCAEDVGAKLHIGEIVLAHLKEARKEERPLDSSSLYGVLRREAGLDFATDFVEKRDGVQ